MTEWTWREIARMTFLNDALSDLGYSKQESANFVKGYRSGGHPNSKEAKRWKKIEDSSIVMTYQRLDVQDTDSDLYRTQLVRANVSTPCGPSCVPTDWRFFLHNIKSRDASPTLSFLKSNVEKAVAELKKECAGPTSSDEGGAAGSSPHVAELEKCLDILKAADGTDAVELQKAKQIAVAVLDSTKEKFAPSAAAADAKRERPEPSRQKMGILQSYRLTEEEYKQRDVAKEEYMAAALTLKTELERKAEGEEEEDDDDDDEEDFGKKSEDDKESEGQKGEETKQIGDAAPDSNGDVEMEDVSSETKPSDVSSETKPSDAPQADEEAEKQKGSDESEAKEDEQGDTADAALAGDGETKKADEDADGESEAAAEEQPNAPVFDEITYGHPTLADTDAYPEEEPAPGFPEGWTTHRVARPNPADKRTDKAWFSPKLQLKFRSKSDALKFVGHLRSAGGDETKAILAYHNGRPPSTRPQSKQPKRSVGRPRKDALPPAPKPVEPDKVEYEFCEDVPDAPDLIRRCIAVIRALVQSSSADQFIYPVDPQAFPS